MQDYFAAEQPIIDRVKAIAPELRGVLPAVDTFTILERVQIEPAAYVMYSGDLVADDSDESTGQVVLQRWTVVLSGRNVRDQAGGFLHRQVMGPLMARIAQGLIGWRPADGFGEMRKTTTADQPFYREGYGYFPQTFVIPFLLIGSSE